MEYSDVLSLAENYLVDLESAGAHQFNICEDIPPPGSLMHTNIFDEGSVFVPGVGSSDSPFFLSDEPFSNSEDVLMSEVVGKSDFSSWHSQPCHQATQYTSSNQCSNANSSNVNDQYTSWGQELPPTQVPTPYQFYSQHLGQRSNNVAPPQTNTPCSYPPNQYSTQTSFESSTYNPVNYLANNYGSPRRCPSVALSPESSSAFSFSPNSPSSSYTQSPPSTPGYAPARSPPPSLQSSSTYFPPPSDHRGVQPHSPPTQFQPNNTQQQPQRFQIHNIPSPQEPQEQPQQKRQKKGHAVETRANPMRQHTPPIDQVEPSSPIPHLRPPLHPPPPPPQALPYSLQILGLPSKSRVETRMKMCLRLLSNTSNRLCTRWSQLEIDSHLVVPQFLRRKTSSEQRDVSESVSGNAGTLLLSAQVFNSDCTQTIQRCYGCIQRERKSLEKKVKDKDLLSQSEKDSILQFYSEPVMSFSTGEVILPLRLTCYCRHHREHKGFLIKINLYHPKTKEVVATASSSLVMITDDRKSQKKRLNTGEEKVIAEPEPEPTKIKSEAQQIERLIPTEGPVAGGIEVTVLGTGFHSGLRCLFGNTEAPKTQLWGDATLIATLPPALCAGPVTVTLRDMKNPNQVIQNWKDVIFTYVNDSNKQLFELALQVIGMKLTGRIDNPTEIAMNIVASSQDGKSLDLKNNGKDSNGPSQMMASLGMPSNESNEGIIELHAPVMFASWRSPRHKLDQMPLDQSVIIKAIKCAATLRTSFPLDLSIQNKRGHTLLHLAVANNYTDIFDAILSISKDEDVIGQNLQDFNGWTPLHFAAFQGHSHLVKSLVNAGALPLLNNENGDRPRDLAREPETLRMLDSITPKAATLSLAPTPAMSTTSVSSTSPLHSPSPKRRSTPSGSPSSGSRRSSPSSSPPRSPHSEISVDIDVDVDSFPQAMVSPLSASQDLLTSLLESLSPFSPPATSEPESDPVESELDPPASPSMAGSLSLASSFISPSSASLPPIISSPKEKVMTYLEVLSVLFAVSWGLMQKFWSEYRVFMYIGLLAATGSWSLVDYLPTLTGNAGDLPRISLEKGLSTYTTSCNPPRLGCGNPDVASLLPSLLPIEEKATPWAETLQTLQPIKNAESYMLSFGQFAVFITTILLILYHFKGNLGLIRFWVSNFVVFVCFALGCIFIFDVV